MFIWERYTNKKKQRRAKIFEYCWQYRSEREITEHIGAELHTIRKDLAEMIAEGLIEKVPWEKGRTEHKYIRIGVKVPKRPEK